MVKINDIGPQASGDRAFTILQITDSHLNEPASATLAGMNTDQSLDDVIDLAQNQATPDIILATGDIANSGKLGAYQRFLAKMARLPAPMHWLPGNHDLTAAMEQASGQRLTKCVDTPHWRLILLDSHIEGAVPGQLSDRELALLTSLLEDAGQRFVAVFSHHPPVEVGSAWLDQQRIANGDAFLDLLLRYPRVKLCCFGHVHQQYSTTRGALALYATPSSCIQFAPDCDDFELDHTMPGFRTVALYPDGSHSTEVTRVSDRDYRVDYQCGGY